MKGHFLTGSEIERFRNHLREEEKSENKSLAEEYYDLALKIDPDDPECMYLKGRLLQSEDRISEANAIYDKIIGEHPESKYAERAVQARGY